MTSSLHHHNMNYSLDSSSERCQQDVVVEALREQLSAATATTVVEDGGPSSSCSAHSAPYGNVQDEVQRLKALRAFHVLTDNEDDEDDKNVEEGSPISTTSNEGMGPHVQVVSPPEPAAPACYSSSTTKKDLSAVESSSALQASLDRLVQLASHMFHVPMAVISVTDLHRQKILACTGLEDYMDITKTMELPRHMAPCASVVDSQCNDAIVVLPDITASTATTGDVVEQSISHKLSVAIPQARFYATVPLITPEGDRIGAFCIMDTRPKDGGMTLCEQQDLQHLAALTMQALLERRTRFHLHRQLRSATRVVSATVHDLLTPLTAAELALSMLYEDQEFTNQLSLHQQESIKIATNCIGVLGRMCRRMRDQQQPQHSHGSSSGIRNSGMDSSFDSHCQQPQYSHTTNSNRNSGMDSSVDSHCQQAQVLSVNSCHSHERRQPKRTFQRRLSNADSGLTADSFRIMYGTGGFHNGEDETNKDTAAATVVAAGGTNTDPDDETSRINHGIHETTTTKALGHDDDDDDDYSSTDMLLMDDGKFLAAVPSPQLVTTVVAVQDLAKSIHMAMDAIPKTVPISIALHASVPSHIVTDDLKLLRCALNLLQHCASIATDAIHLSIKAQYCSCGKDMLGFLCQLKKPQTEEQNKEEGKPKLLAAEAADQGIHKCCRCTRQQQQPEEEESPEEESSSSYSSLLSSSSHHHGECCHSQGRGQESLRDSSEINVYSVSMQIGALGGDCGYHMPSCNSSNQEEEHGFWFRIPLEIPTDAAVKKSDKFPVAEVAPPPAVGIATTTTATTTMVESAGGSDKKSQEASSAADADKCSNSIALVLEAQPRKRRALIIEDSIVIRKVIANALNKIGIDAELAVNGMEGLHCLQSSVYDVVLCDFLMPVMDGLDCVQQYRQWETTHRPYIRQYIIGMSAHASDQDVEKGLRAGMDSYKPKPLTYKGLKDIVDACEKNQQNLLSHKGDNGRNYEQSVERYREQPKMCLIASKDDCYDLARLTEARGWKSLIVHDGDDALQALKKRNFDAVLLDEKLPHLSGRKCVAEFREWERENRVNSQTDVFILMAPKKGEASNGVIQIPQGANGVMQKPVQPKKFERLLRKAEEPSLNIIMR